MQQISIKRQINKELDILPANLQKKVLEFVSKLARKKTPKRRDGEKLAELAGSLSQEEANELEEIIDRNCENIDNEW